jgi:hypothetical protein
MTVRVRELTRTDAQIEREIREDVLERTMWIDTGNVDISVQSGHAARLASRVPGVVAVKSAVAWNVDESTRKGRRALEASD